MRFHFSGRRIAMGIAVDTMGASGGPGGVASAENAGKRAVLRERGKIGDWASRDEECTGGAGITTGRSEERHDIVRLGIQRETNVVFFSRRRFPISPKGAKGPLRCAFVHPTKDHVRLPQQGTSREALRSSFAHILWDSLLIVALSFPLSLFRLIATSFHSLRHAIPSNPIPFPPTYETTRRLDLSPSEKMMRFSSSEDRTRDVKERLLKFTERNGLSTSSEFTERKEMDRRS